MSTCSICIESLLENIVCIQECTLECGLKRAKHAPPAGMWGTHLLRFFLIRLNELKFQKALEEKIDLINSLKDLQTSYDKNREELKNIKLNNESFQMHVKSFAQENESLKELNTSLTNQVFIAKSHQEVKTLIEGKWETLENLHSLCFDPGSYIVLSSKFICLQEYGYSKCVFEMMNNGNSPTSLHHNGQLTSTIGHEKETCALPILIVFILFYAKNQHPYSNTLGPSVSQNL
ncbi:hypothetical protein MXB_650 [Myxobolus squamalis]|nr:hypothetical protein MXB_650 [Myxobolus squamalis]